MVASAPYRSVRSDSACSGRSTSGERWSGRNQQTNHRPAHCFGAARSGEAHGRLGESMPSRREQVFSSCEAGAACEALQSWFFTTSSHLLQVSFYRKQTDSLCKWSRIHRVLHCHHGRVPFSGVKNEILAVRRDACWTLGPKGLDLTEPAANFSPKEAVG